MMDREQQSKILMESFIRLVNKYNAMEKHPLSFGTNHKFYHSERHLLDMIGNNRKMNISEFARLNGVTKGAVSQIVSKLEKKGALRRFNVPDNDKEVFIELTEKGKEIYEHHQKVNERTVSALEVWLNNYSDDSVESLLDIFKWLEGYLDEGKKEMEKHARA